MAWGGLTFSLLLIFLAMATILLFRSRSLQEQSGLPAGQVIYTDAGTWFRNKEPLHSTEQRLVGKPDYLVQQENGEIIPVEIKSGSAPDTPWPGHILQLAAYCWLVDEVYGKRPSFGILQYQDQAFTVDYSSELEEELLYVMQEMRLDHQSAGVNRSHSDVAKCSACGLREKCLQRIA
jgi:CRISPR-associated exonuclease Cas4